MPMIGRIARRIVADRPRARPRRLRRREAGRPRRPRRRRPRPTTTFDTETTPVETTRLRVYFLLNGKVQPVAREVPKTQAVARRALDDARRGPDRRRGRARADVDASTSTSRASRGSRTVIATLDGAVATSRTGPRPDRLHADAVPDGEARGDRRASATRAPTSRTRRRRILVESPLAVRDGLEPDPRDGHGQHVRGELPVRGRRPERQGRRHELRHRDVRERARAARSTSRRSAYKGVAGEGALVVLEFSAKDGSRTKEVRIPIQLKP